jgi:hemoglobin
VPHLPSLYQALGGEAAVRALTEAFYDRIEKDPGFAALHRLHLSGRGVAHAREQQFAFLSGFLGGPRLYLERHGPVPVRDIHAHVGIGPDLRDLWLAAMRKAVADVGTEPALAETLMRQFERAAEVVRNR